MTVQKQVPSEKPEERTNDLDAEIASHLQMATAERVALGQDPAEARAAALREFGNVALVKDVSAGMRGDAWLIRVLRDVRFAFRQIRSNPGFSVTAVTILSLGIAVPTVMYTVLGHALFEQLPMRDGDRLIRIEMAAAGDLEFGSVPYSRIASLQRSFTNFGSFCLVTDDRHIFFLRGDKQTAQVSAPRVSNNFFSLLGVEPEIGRDFESLQGSVPRLMLSDEVWHALFSGDPSIVGRAVTLNDREYVVSGVMPQRFKYPLTSGVAQVWVSDLSMDEFPTKPYVVLARLPGEMSVKEMQRRLDSLSSQTNGGAHFKGVLLASSLETSGVKKGLTALFAASLLLWLITCANASSLFLARAMVRQKELAIRQAFGASRSRIGRQLFIEGAVIASIAAAAALICSEFILAFSKQVIKTLFQIDINLKPDPMLLLLLVFLVALTSVLCSVLPVTNLSENLLMSRMLGGTRSQKPRRERVNRRKLLIIFQIGLSLALLVTCGLLISTVHALRTAPIGFERDNLIVANVKVPAYRFKNTDILESLLQPLSERLRQADGVDAVTLISSVPLTDFYDISVSYNAHDVNQSQAVNGPRIHLRAVGPNALSVFGFKMLAGRYFNDSDTRTSPFVVVVNKAFAQSYLGPRRQIDQVIGMQVLSDGTDRPGQVIGVVDDTPTIAVDSPYEPEINICIAQVGPKSHYYGAVYQLAMSIVLRTQRSSSSIVPIIDADIAAQAPEFGNVIVTPMDQIVEDSYRNKRLGSQLVTLFAFSALILASTGLYGLLSHIVGRRSKEIGIRMALGSSRRNIMLYVMTEAILLIIVGVIAGNLLIIASAHFLSPFLYGVHPWDGLIFVLANFAIIVASLCAAFIPARRAAKLDISQTLRMN